MFDPNFLLIGLGILMLVIYVPVLVAPKAAGKVFHKTLKDNAMMRSYGFYLLLLSFLMLATHWQFSGDWMMYISIVGWLMFLKGLIFIWSPEYVEGFAKYTKEETLVSLAALGGIVLSVFTIYVGMNLV